MRNSRGNFFFIFLFKSKSENLFVLKEEEKSIRRGIASENWLNYIVEEGTEEAAAGLNNFESIDLAD